MKAHEVSEWQAAGAALTDAPSAEALLRACLARIESHEARVHAWAHFDAAYALSQAQLADDLASRGPLHGVPVGIKDLIDTADMPTTYGSPIHAGHRPDTDALCVARLRAGGAVIMGKTVSTEFAAFAPLPTRNPVDPARTPGGSSSGSAAAVEAGMVPLALGSQTAGSVIRPAAFCGVVGFKPTHGRIALDGVHPFAPSLDTLGTFAAHIADAALGAAVIADAGTPLARLTGPAAAIDSPAIGFLRTPFWERAEAPYRDALEYIAGQLGVRDIEAPDGFADLIEAQDTLMWGEGARSLAGVLARDADRLTEGFRARLEAGAKISESELDAARGRIAEYRRRLDEVFAGADVVLTPAALGEAPMAETTGDPLFNRIWTALGVPCLTLPFADGPNGLSLGAQLIARHDDEARLIAVASWLEGCIERAQ